MDDQTQVDQTHKIDRLIDAIELVKAERRQEALPILRALIHEDSDFEDAWLWMSVAVDEMDQSIICLDNVLRINPNNRRASIALYHLQEAESAAERQRERLRRYRDLALIGFWLLIAIILFSVFVSISNQAVLLEMTATP